MNTKTDIGWGHQIRSYVLQPYQLVKDLRKSRKYNPSSVLDGNIDQFIEEGIKTGNEKDLSSIFILLFVFLITFLIILSQSV